MLIIKKVMNKTVKSILYSVITVVCIIVVAVIIGALSGKFVPKYDGEVTVEYVNGDINKTEKIKFSEGDLLEELIEENFDNVLFKDGMLYNIEDFVTPDDWSKYIWVYIDDESATVGIGQLEFKDGTKISLVVTDNDYSFE